MRRWCVPLLAGAVFAGCSNAPARIGDPAPQVSDSRAESSYRKIFEEATRRTQLYDALDAKVFAAATQQSPTFVAARAERMATFEGLLPADTQALVAKDLADASKTYGFFLGVHTDARRENDFDRPHSIWRLALKSSAGEVTPISVERVFRPNANVRGIYLYLADFWLGYRVVFPQRLPSGQALVGPSDTEVTLKLDSAVGHGRLIFPALPPAPVVSPTPAERPTTATSPAPALTPAPGSAAP